LACSLGSLKDQILTLTGFNLEDRVKVGHVPLMSAIEGRITVPAR